ncbi:hypothetical protein BHE74_00016966 [Ensete ventricosum]|nr:hypothetical protein BHE74_00016966 [Ensete ventricosum]
MKLQSDDRPRSSLGIGPGSDNVVEPRREFTRRFTEGIKKLTRNTPGDCWKKIIGHPCKNIGRYQIKREVGQHQVQTRIRKVEGTTFPEISAGKPLVSSGWTARTLEIGWRPAITGG